MQSTVSRFHRIVETHPDCPALVSDMEQVSYRDLDRRSARIAEAIRHWFWSEKSRAITSTDVIGVCIEKCASLYAAIFGILETGASYVPLDPDLPQEIRQHIVDKCGCQLILVTESPSNTPDRCAVLSVDRVPSSDLPSVVQPAGILPTDLCYSIFTSGTTGKPKGVMVNHGNVINLVDWAIEHLGITPGSRALQYSTVNFDASILDIFPTLLSGGALCIPTASQRLSATELAAFCRRHGVDRAFLPPTLLAVLDPGAFDTISTLLTGGEACSPQVVRTWSVSADAILTS
ncbi:AMP-binding protein [Variovorax sp. GB1P17]|uniref:AMP-binding protein n=1 Tax=Variovorax sp. GB1P17 TaxID=3443740 RepID=UPI003F44F446